MCNNIKVFLDFDGVLFDTVLEAYLLSRCAYDGISPLEPVDNSEFKLFHKYRYLITKSRHFYNVMKGLKKGISEEEFEQYYNSANPDTKEAEDFDKKYVSARQDLMDKNFAFWDNLDKPFDFFFEIKKLAQKHKKSFIILTNKKKTPILKKIKKYDLDIPVYANEELEKFKNKGYFIDNYLKKNKIDNAIFVDDSSENIATCKNFRNIQCILANWGYINPNLEGKNCEQTIKIIKEKL